MLDNYQGRKNAFFASESGYKREEITLPQFEVGRNTTFHSGDEEQKFSNMMRLNALNPRTQEIDALYVGVIQPFYRCSLTLEAEFPTEGNGYYWGFEINSGGAYSYLACMALLSDSYQLRHVSRDEGTTTLNIDSVVDQGTQTKIGLFHDPPFLSFYDENVSELAYSKHIILQGRSGTVQPFMAHEPTYTDPLDDPCWIGNFWCQELTPSPGAALLVDGATPGNSETTLTDIVRWADTKEVLLWLRAVDQDATIQVYADIEETFTNKTEIPDGTDYTFDLTAGAGWTLYGWDNPYSCVRVTGQNKTTDQATTIYVAATVRHGGT
jgi:hypothetical protein